MYPGIYFNFTVCLTTFRGIKPISAHMCQQPKSLYFETI